MDGTFLLSEELSRNVPSRSWASLPVLDVWNLMRSQQVLTWLQVVTWIQALGCFWCYIFHLQKKKTNKQLVRTVSTFRLTLKKEAFKSLAENLFLGRSKSESWPWCAAALHDFFEAKGCDASRSVRYFTSYNCTIGVQFVLGVIATWCLTVEQVGSFYRIRRLKKGMLLFFFV